MPQGTISAAGLAFRTGFGTLDAESERHSLRTVLGLFFPLPSIVRFAAYSLGWLAGPLGFSFCDLFADLLQQFGVVVPRAGLRAASSPSFFGVLPVPFAMFLGAFVATSLPLYCGLAAAA